MTIKFYLCLIILVSTSIYPQNYSIQKISGVNVVTTNNQSGIAFQVPLSYLDLMNTPRRVPTEDNSLIFNWVLKFTAGNKVFKDVSFANTQAGYIVTELGAVYKSTNGGDNWVSVMNLGFPYYWYGVHALTPDTVIISGFNNQGQITTGVVRWTFNGGSTWTGDIILHRQGAGVGWLERVHFFNQNTGNVFNTFSGACYYTTTGGKDSTAWTICSGKFRPRLVCRQY